MIDGGVTAMLLRRASRGDFPNPGQEKEMPVANANDLQVAAAKIAKRASTDAAFKKRLMKDPVAALSSLRLGKDAVRELILGDPDLSRVVGGKPGLGAAGDCNVTCICTGGCCVTKIGHADIFSNPAPSIRLNAERKNLVANLIRSGTFRAG